MDTNSSMIKIDCLDYESNYSELVFRLYSVFRL